MKHTILKALAVSALVAGGIAATSQIALAGSKTYRVTVANATGGQPLAPGLLITHNSSFSLFQVNAAPSLGLATMAETGDPSVLAGEVSGAPGVSAAEVLVGSGAGAPVALPGETNSRLITASGNAKYFSAAGMLAATNDAVYAVRGVRLPKHGKITVHAAAYDAGSEANNEIGTDIPAVGGNVGDPGVDNGDGEGFIHIHRGVHGGVDLDPATHDWRNPVVEITIERVSGHN
ncbi:MAG: hypothetical protein HOM58_03140 [Rhodospirillaceae bacterium]|jgi:hypothetical protein|nr:hypothetical protein [Rhodospirillaceae bacterium]MBT5456454.1 hypothetical protein [Rhodospirillaceae bacterium]